MTMRRKLPCEIDCGGTPPLWQGSLWDAASKPPLRKGGASATPRRGDSPGWQVSTRVGAFEKSPTVNPSVTASPLSVFLISYYLLSLGVTNGSNPYGMLFSGVGLLVGLPALAVFQYAFVLNASLDLPAWAILKNSRALTFLGLKYTIGILGITCFVDAALLFGFPISLVLLVLGFPTLVQFIVCCLGNIPMQKRIVEPYLRQQEENAET